MEYERRLDEAVASEPEVRALVERLEQQIDDEDISFRNLPSGRLDRAGVRALPEGAGRREVGRAERVAFVAIVADRAGCGDDSNDDGLDVDEGAAPMPASLRTVESASEDIIDLALAGERAEVVQQSRAARRGGAGAWERGV